MDNYPSSLSPSSSRIELLDSSSPQEEEQIQPDFMVIREREHMFDKVVTPSDVGKLNRLVIPKQHAEKYFPLDASSHDDEDKIKGGLLLNFEDYRTGKLWRFRYSYWNSSQSYVMTKGWSRFVKEKKLNPGDIVSFLRNSSSSISSSSGSNSNNNKFFIDWRRRRMPYNCNVPLSPPLPFDLLRSRHPHLLLPPRPQDDRHQPFYPSVYLDHFAPNLLNVRRSMLLPYAPQPHCNIITRSMANYSPPSSSSSYADYHQMAVQQEVHREEGRAEGRVLLEPVPVVQRKGGAAGKRLRLFGVNMDCPNV